MLLAGRGGASEPAGVAASRRHGAASARASATPPPRPPPPLLATSPTKLTFLKMSPSAIKTTSSSAFKMNGVSPKTPPAMNGWRNVPSIMSSDAPSFVPPKVLAPAVRSPRTSKTAFFTAASARPFGVVPQMPLPAFGLPLSLKAATPPAATPASGLTAKTATRSAATSPSRRTPKPSPTPSSRASPKTSPQHRGRRQGRHQDVVWAEAVLQELRSLKARAVSKARSVNKGCPAKGCIAPYVRVPRVYSKWRARRVAPAACTRVQELDDGFFEKFGTLLGETQRADDVATCSVARSHQLGAAPMAACSVAEAVSGEDAAADPGKDPTLADALGEAVGGLQVDGTARMDQSDSETEEAVKQENISDFVGMNVEELYSEVLYLLIHNVGSDVTTASDRSDLCRLLQEAFKIDDEKHAQLMGNVEAKEAPKIVLNVEVMEAQDLKPKDSNGMCDPFCTLYLSSAPTHRYNTSVKTETLTPCWMEYFSLPVHNATDDVLFVEVWDFDPAETVREKMSKLTDVKGVRGLRKLVKEIAVTASTGKHDNEYIGTAQINLNCIATGGQTQWVNLEKKNKTKKQGVIKLHMAFGAEKDTQVARQEHRHLLRLLLMHHLEKAKLEPYAWCGEFDELATTIIRQHAVQSGLSSTDETLARWMEFCSVHVDHPLSFALFSQLANKLKKPLEEGNLSPEEVKHFWDATKKFLPSCLNSIRRLRKLSNCDRNTLTQLSGIVTTLSCLKPLPVPEGLDLFPSSVYGWLNQSDQSSCDISHVLTEAVKHGAEDWLCYVLENNTADGPTQEDSLRHVIKLVQLVRSDLTKAIEYHDKIFLKGIGLAYSSILYKVYEEKVCEEAEPVVKDVCGQLRPIRINDSDPRINLEREEPLSMGTTLFELYLALQRLSLIGSTLCPNDVDSFQIAKFHNWFYHGVAQWLDIACYKAVQRVKKAVELDTLVPVDSSVKYSSSAVDTFAIFYQIKIFWQQLAWPDVEGSYTFVLKIIDDICKCSEVYADNMSQKVDGMGETNQGTVHEKKFQVTQEWCLAINNIDYVRQSIQPFVAELGMDNIVKALADFRSVAAAEQCKGTLSGIIENSIDVVRNKIIDLLLIVANKMDPAIKRFLQEGADLLNQDSNAVDRLMQYLDENLVMLHSELNTENFERILSIMWDNVSNILSELVESSLEKRKPPSFFSNLHETLNILIGFFRQGDLQQQLQEQQQIEQLNGMKQVQNDDVIDSSVDKHSKLRRVERILRLHGMETPELSYQFYVQRLMEQKKLQSMGDAPYQGLLTIRAQFVDNALSIEIMNARNIKPMDSNGSCDPYVKIHLVPEDKFVNVQKPRTKTHKKNLFPLFDETFHIPLTPEQRARGIIAFILKDQDFLGNEFIAEAFHSFEDIPENDASTSLQTLPQVHLKLHRPQNVLESDVMKALEHRQGDKLARDFVKRQKAKFGEGKQQNGSK